MRRWLSPLHRHSSPTPRSSSRVHGSAGGRTRQKQSRPRTVYTAASALQKPTWPPRSASPGGVAGCGVCTARSRTPGTVLPHHPPLYGSLTILLSPRILQGRKVRHTGGTNCCRAGVKRSSHSRSLQRGRVRPRRAARAGQEGRDGAEGGPASSQDCCLTTRENRSIQDVGIGCSGWDRLGMPHPSPATPGSGPSFLGGHTPGAGSSTSVTTTQTELLPRRSRVQTHVLTHLFGE